MISRTTSEAILRASLTPRSTWSQFGRRWRLPVIPGVSTACSPGLRTAGLVPGRAIRHVLADGRHRVGIRSGMTGLRHLDLTVQRGCLGTARLHPTSALCDLCHIGLGGKGPGQKALGPEGVGLVPGDLVFCPPWPPRSTTCSAGWPPRAAGGPPSWRVVRSQANELVVPCGG
jgi:hypothetical protein